MKDTTEPLLLALDTSTSCSSVAITQGKVDRGAVLASITLSSNITHSRRLLTTIDWLFKEMQLDWPDLDGIGVGLGPGSFTGLRIGLATAKGLAGAANLPLIGVSTLDGLAATVTTEKRICSVLDARKKEVYAAFYKKDRKGMPQRLGEIVAVRPESLLNTLEGEVVMVGDGIAPYGHMWQEMQNLSVTFAPPELNVPSAASLGLLAGVNWVLGETLDLDTATPLYVRASDAELSLIAKKKGPGAG